MTTDPQPVPPIAEELATVERLAVRLHEEFRPLAGDVLIFEDCLEIARLAVGTLRREVATAYDRGLAEGRRQAAEGLSVWEIRGYIADYGPYAAMSSSSGYNDPDEARAYFTTAIADTADALVLLVEVRAGGWERIADRWRPDPAVLAFERELDMDRLVGPWEPDEQPEAEEGHRG